MSKKNLRCEEAHQIVLCLVSTSRSACYVRQGADARQTLLMSRERVIGTAPPSGYYSGDHSNALMTC